MDTLRIFVADTKYVIRGVTSIRRDGQVLFACQDWERAEYMVAADLMARKIVTGETFKFLRKTLGMGKKSLAKALFHPTTYPDPEKSIADWESGAVPVDLAVWERLGDAIKEGPRFLDPELTSAEAMAEVQKED